MDSVDSGNPGGFRELWIKGEPVDSGNTGDSGSTVDSGSPNEFRESRWIQGVSMNSGSPCGFRESQ